ncbi:MAG: response regulator [Actinomycetia bacterium]|nr:response regulator [Actinomycetes bacterium]
MSKIKILCIDDAKEVVDFLKVSLELEGYEVDIAYNGQEGLNKIEKNKYDIVITDLQMPKMDGWQLCEEIKNRDETKDLPIIALSIFSPEPSRKPCADVHLVKPFDFHYLKSEIEKLVKK